MAYVGSTPEQPSVLTATRTVGDLANKVQRIALVTSLGDATTPGTEVSGGGYARQTPTWSAQTGSGFSTAFLATPVDVTNMPACEIHGWEGWSADGSTRYVTDLISPSNRGSAASATDVISFEDSSRGGYHGDPTSGVLMYANGDKIIFRDAPGGLAPRTVYYVRDATPQGFKVAATSGGTALDVTADGPVYFGKVITVADGAAVTVSGLGMYVEPDYKSEVLADSPLLYLKLDEASGTTAADSSGNGRSGAHGTGVAPGNASLLGSGSGMSAKYVAATTSLTRVPYASWMNTPTFTTEARIKPDAGSLTGTHILAGRLSSGSTASTRAWFLCINGGKLYGLVHRTSPDAETALTGATALVANTVYTVGMTWDGTTINLFLNGVVDASLSYSGQLGAPAIDFTVGTADGVLGTAANYYAGVLDEVSLYGTALSASRMSVRHFAALFNPTTKQF